MAKKEAESKTNAMRMLETLGIPYESETYACDEFEDGQQVADALGLPHEKVYKTLVCEGAGKSFYVFVIPIDGELDLKKAARSVSEKRLEMLHVRDLRSVTGYVRGGCTAVGMKKAFPVRIHRAAAELEDFYVSAGRIGCQLHVSPGDWLKASRGEWADLTR